MIDSLLVAIQRWWWFLRRRRYVDRVVFVQSRRQLPAQLGAAIYLVGTGSIQWAVLNCPCRCGERANVKISADSSGSRVSVAPGRVSLHPSVLMSATRCRSHFFVQDNRIIWVDSSR